MYGQNSNYRMQTGPPEGDVVSGDQYRYALQNFRIAHDKVESQRQQLEEQERQVAALKARIALLEGGEDAGGRKPGSTNQGVSSVDDFSIRTAASKLEKLINRWAADVVRAPPVSLNHVREAALIDLEGPQPEADDATAVICQNLLRHAMSEAICEGIVNVLVVTNSNEANDQLTRIHEHIFARDPTVASVWRRQTFSAAVENCSPHLSRFILQEHIPSIYQLLWQNADPPAAVMSILDSAYAFSRMLHGSRSSSGGVTDAFYRAYVPELGSILYPRQIELVKRCLKSECNEIDRVGSCIFFGLVKMTRAPLDTPPGPDGEPPEMAQTVVRRAQVICECALGMVAAATAANQASDMSYSSSATDYQSTPPTSYAASPPPGSHGYQASNMTHGEHWGGIDERAHSNGYQNGPFNGYPTPPQGPLTFHVQNPAQR